MHTGQSGYLCIWREAWSGKTKEGAKTVIAWRRKFRATACGDSFGWTCGQQWADSGFPTQMIIGLTRQCRLTRVQYGVVSTSFPE